MYLAIRLVCEDDREVSFRLVILGGEQPLVRRLA